MAIFDPISDLVFLTETRKRGWELLVGGFGARVVFMTLPKPYPISTWISEVAERQSKKIEKINFCKKTQKIDFFKLQKFIDLNNAESSEGRNKPPTFHECALLSYKNSAKLRLRLVDPMS